jgi:hypothetical protein
MGAHGIPQNRICSVLDITVPTLHRHFRRELDVACTLATVRVAEALFNAAMDGDVRAIIFWLKCRAGWRVPPTMPRQGQAEVVQVRFQWAA